MSSTPLPSSNPPTATANTIPPSSLPSEPVTRTTSTIHIELTPYALNPLRATTFVSSPLAGATVLFIGTTRNSFASQAVSGLSYTSYTPLAMSTLYAIASSILAKHQLTKICIVHRLGECPVGEQSILIAVSSPHRQAAWRAGEECLEETKRRAEIWKLERFEGGEGVWRANRDGAMGVRVEDGHGDGKEAEVEKNEKSVFDGKNVGES